MRNDIVYVHLDKVSHLTLTYGIGVKDFIDGCSHLPKNVLSLAPVDPNQEIDIYSGFNMYIGIENVKAFLQDRSNENLCWIDFDNSFDLESLTPQEVSEMLYLGHAFTHLKSPFYYKLQNNFVYLTLPNGANKVYYRFLPNFYHIMVQALTNHLAKAYREKRAFLRLRYRIQAFPVAVAKQLLPLMISGAVFDFGGLKLRGPEITIPILAAPDSVYQLKWHEPTMMIEKSNLVGRLKYQLNTGKWDLLVLTPEAFEDNLNF